MKELVTFYNPTHVNAADLLGYPHSMIKIDGPATMRLADMVTTCQLPPTYASRCAYCGVTGSTDAHACSQCGAPRD